MSPWPYDDEVVALERVPPAWSLWEGLEEYFEKTGFEEYTPITAGVFVGLALAVRHPEWALLAHQHRVPNAPLDGHHRMADEIPQAIPLRTVVPPQHEDDQEGGEHAEGL